MPSGTIPINVSQDFVFHGTADVALIADSSLGGPFTGIDLTIVVTDLSGISTSFGLVAENNGDPEGTNAQCVVTPALGAAYHWICDQTANQPSRIQIYVYPRGPGAFPRTLRVNATGTFSFSASGNCANGTRPKAGATFLYWLTPGLLDVWLAAAGLPWVAPVLTSLWFSSIDLTGICGAGPGPIPVLDNSVLSWSTDQKIAFVKAVAWFSLCECIPGSPPPIPFPPPAANPPTTFPPFPTFPCSDVDPCAAIVQLQRSVAAIAAATSNTNELVTLLQRHRLPFAYILGSSHLNLSGTGTLTLPSGLLGLMLTLDVIPPGTLTLVGNPVYNENLGWVSILDANGFIDEKRVTRTPHIWLPANMQDVTKFGYNLSAGVQLRVTELQAEP